jgi:glutamyl-tRNA reductase
MHIIVAGLDYKTTPVETRERLAFQEDTLPQALQELRDMKSILECVIVSTCNRTEVYAVVDQLHTGRHFVKKFLGRWFEMPQEDFGPFLNIRENDAAVQHLFQVASGLDSMVIGETQILGQVKHALATAHENETTGTIFNELFKRAVTYAKRAHHETEINDNSVSVSYAAVELGKKVVGSFKNKRVLVLGAGKMSELTAKHLHSGGAAEVTVFNRTYEKAEQIAAQFNGQAKPMEELTDALAQADVLISSTGSDSYVLNKEQVASASKKRKGKPLFMVDIAVPRDLDPALNQLDNVFLYDIDDLQDIVNSNMEERKKAAALMERMIHAEVSDFKDWVHTLGVVPVISALRTKALAIQADTMDSVERKLPELTEREKKVLRKHTKSIINQMIKDPITKAKEMADNNDAEEMLQLFTEIFALEEEVEEARAAEERQIRKEEAEEEWNASRESRGFRLPYAYATDVAVRS